MQVGTTPAAWNAGVFSLIRQLSETVILPIAGLILTFVATYELIQLIIEKNNLHDLDYWIFFKWIFKTACAILILSNTFNIVMAVFDVSQSVIARAAGIVQGSTDISEAMLADLEATLETLGLGSLLGLWLQSLLIHVTMWAINIVIFVIVYKNLFLYTKMRNVAGLSTSDAQKSSDMFAKCRYMDEITGNRGVIFATGTPVSNSMTELYTMQRYLQYERLQELNMTHFDCWASRFGETVTALELAPEGYTLIGR